LACTVELAHPKVRSWFASGDLRQRVTVNGIAEESEIGWLNDVTSIAVEVRKIDIGYRQSQRLRGLSDALAELLMPGSNAKTKAPRGSEEADVRPILGENLADGELARWLAARIDEVEQAVGRLPSIAVFVDGDDLIDPLVASTRDLLAERNIPLVGCKEGHVVGDAREVRVFDIKHIKGLEFEAVFFVGIDRLAARIPDLFHRFLYVGVTRAATYLGVTSKGTLPRRLETVRPHFTVEGWTKV
jgi:superfamily I DNA/RNA helicase